MSLRPYQQAALEAIRDNYADGVNKQLIVLPTGCHAPGQGILMLDGSIRRVEDVRTGDLLMGPDSTPRHVLGTIHGHGTMVRIDPKKGASFAVNEDHLLSLIRTNVKSNPLYPCQLGGAIIDIPVTHWLHASKTFRHEHKLFRVPITFQQQAKPLPIDPYFLGILLGDGGISRCVSVSKPDQEIYAECLKQAEIFDLNVRTTVNGSGCPTYYLSRPGSSHNRLMTIIRQLRINTTAHHKFIPVTYKYGTMEQRLELLAGLMDTDGHLTGGCYDYISASEQLTDDVVYVARSVGLAAYKRPCKKSCSNHETGYHKEGIYYRASISGRLSLVPCRIPRKKAPPRMQKKDVLRQGFSVTPIGHGEYFGFTVDADNRYVMEDFTVTHNCGKAVIAANVPSVIPLNGKQMLFMAHRNQLVEQAARQISKFNPGLRVSIDRAEYLADLTGDVVVASVPTLGRGLNGEFSSRLKRYNIEHVSTIQLDEVHRFPGNRMFLAPLRYFRVFKGEPDNCDPDKILIAWTATPERTDGIGLDTILDKIVFSRDIREMIEAGWLAKILAYRIETQTDLTDVKFARGDFQIRDLENAVNIPERNRLVVEKYKELGGGRPGIAFTVDIAHSHDLAAEFRRQGISALPLSGDTPDAERKRILESIGSDTMIAVSCGVMNEGVDVPVATVGCLARPTSSSLLFRQQIGRLLRPYPAPEEGTPTKTSAIILDFCDLSARHRLVSVASLFGLAHDFDPKGRSITDSATEVEEAQAKHRQLNLQNIRSLEDLRATVEHIDLLKPPRVPDEIAAYSRLAWMDGPSGYYIAIPNGAILSIRSDALGNYSVAALKSGLRSVICDNVNINVAFKMADRLVPEDAKHLLSRQASWRNDPPSEKQIRALAKLDRGLYMKFGDMNRFTAYAQSTFTKGDLAAIISEKLRPN